MNERLQTLLAEARTLLADGKIPEAKAKRTEAESLIEAIEEGKKLDEASSRYQPVRPMLPGTAGADAAVQIADGDGNKARGGGTAVLDDDGDAPKDLMGKTQKAAYLTRFGDEASTIKGILTDLHGKNYQGAYWAQKAAFNRYLRGGDNALRPDDRELLENIILNPKAIKMALDQGNDDVASLRATMVEAADSLGR